MTLNNDELVDEIRKLLKKDKKTRELLLDISHPTKKMQEYDYLWEAFHHSKYDEFTREFKFSMLVRAIDKPNTEKFYMYERLWALLIKYRESYDDYFEIQTDDARYSFPNPLNELNKLEVLFEEYHKIFLEIRNRIFFETDDEENIESSVRGKINWQKTILKSNTKIPTDFYSIKTNQFFKTPENILLILCIEWMYRDALRISQLQFKERLDERQTFQLNRIIVNSKKILKTFPYEEILLESKRFWNLDYRNNKKILELEKNVRNRIKDGIITNEKYSEIINWIEKYRNLFLDQVTAELTTNRPITSIEAQDYIYEAWIFFELLDFIESKKGYRCYLKFERRESDKKELDRYFYFYINNEKITIYYEKTYKGGWVRYKDVPDFTVEIDGDVVLVMDAKNYTAGFRSKMVNSIIISYIGSLHAEEGMIFFPDYPENEFMEHMANPETDSRGYTRLRCSPSDKPELIEMRNKSLQYIFDQITKSNQIKLSI